MYEEIRKPAGCIAIWNITQDDELRSSQEAAKLHGRHSFC